MLPSTSFFQHPWTWTGLPGRHPLAGRQDSRSTTPAVDVGIGRPVYATVVGDRAFSVATARTWNSLPPEVTSSDSLQTFKTKLKSHISLSKSPFRVILGHAIPRWPCGIHALKCLCLSKSSLSYLVLNWILIWFCSFSP